MDCLTTVPKISYKNEEEDDTDADEESSHAETYVENMDKIILW